MNEQAVTIDSKITILRKHIPAAMELLKECTVCPKNCRVDRTAGELGDCHMTDRLKISSYNLHFGEEPPISGRRGSGTIFLSGCNLACVYCQNYPISQYCHGRFHSIAQVAGMMLSLQRRGAHNINLVTPTHFVPLLMQALLEAFESGLAIPIVYNTSGYDSVKMLKLLGGVIDIYMPDMRYADPRLSRLYSAANGYPAINRRAIKEMHRQVGELHMVDGVALRGLLLRHLVLPGGIAGSKAIFEFIAREVSPQTHVSVMSQYFPAFRADEYPELSRRLTGVEYRQALDAFERAGLSNGYIQPYTG